MLPQPMFLSQLSFTQYNQYIVTLNTVLKYAAFTFPQQWSWNIIEHMIDYTQVGF